MSRTPFVPAELLSKLWRAVIEFDMLQAGDRILIGLSGGKDSMFLTAALAEIQKYAPVPFDLACYTVDAMFSPAFPKAELEAFCGYYGLKHYSEKVDVNSASTNYTDKITSKSIKYLILAFQHFKLRRITFAACFYISSAFIRYAFSTSLHADIHSARDRLAGSSCPVLSASP